MKDKLLQFCRREQLFPPGSPVVCALSGGADSVALLHCLLTLQEPLQLQVSAAHFNHCLRGEASDEDEAFVRRLCASWNVPLAVGCGDVRRRAAETGESIEESARVLRYEFLLAQPGLIATAHHANDQIETVLLNLLRGTGLRGLCAIAPKQDRIVRPFLETTRAEIESYLQHNSLPHREDHTNLEDTVLRNRLRHHVLPLLLQENPDLAAAVSRMTGLLRQDEAYLAAQTQSLLEQARQDRGYACPVLLDAPMVLRRRAIRALLPFSNPAMVHVDAVEALLHNQDGSASVDLPEGWKAYRQYDLLFFGHTNPPASFTPVSFSPGQTIVLPTTGLSVRWSGPIFLEKKPDYLSTFAIKCDMMDPTPSILIRPRRTGDQLRLSGGTKTIKRLMIDRKIPAGSRGILPVLEDRNGIVAVYRLGADAARAAQPGDRAWIIEILEIEEKHRDDQQI